MTSCSNKKQHNSSVEYLMPLERHFHSLNVHRLMVNDRVRMKAFADAIAEVVKPGDVVVDIGTGTGILAVLCAKAGAKKVFAIEETSIAELAKEVAVANGCDDQVVVLQENSQRLALPVKADVIIAEVVGNFMLEEDINRSISDAVERFLKPGGRVVPSMGIAYCAPIDDECLFESSVTSIGENAVSVDLSPLVAAAANNVIITSVESDSLLCSEQELFRVNFGVAGSRDLSEVIEFEIARDGVCHGVAGWFDIQLSPNSLISTSPDATHTHWKQVFFPISTPFPVSTSDRLEFRFGTHDTDLEAVWHWNLRHHSKNTTEICEYRQSTLCNRPLDNRGLAVRHVQEAVAYSSRVKPSEGQ